MLHSFVEDGANSGVDDGRASLRVYVVMVSTLRERETSAGASRVDTMATMLLGALPGVVTWPEWTK